MTDKIIELSRGVVTALASNGTKLIGCRSNFRKLLIQRSFSCDLVRCLSQAESKFLGLAMQMFLLPHPPLFLEALEPSFDERQNFLVQKLEIPSISWPANSCLGRNLAQILRIVRDIADF